MTFSPWLYNHIWASLVFKQVGMEDTCFLKTSDHSDHAMKSEVIGPFSPTAVAWDWRMKV